MANYGYETYEDPGYQSHGSWMDQLDWGGVRQEVEMEVQSEIVLLGPPDVGKSALYASLRGLPPVDSGLRLGRLSAAESESLGLFTLLDLPLDGGEDDMLLTRLMHASFLVYLLDGAVGAACNTPDSVVRPQDVRWLARLHALGCPLMVAVTKADLWGDGVNELLSTVERRLGEPVVPVSAVEGETFQDAFLRYMVVLCPQLSVPLGREITGFRHRTAQRLILRTALMTGLVSLEPVPLLDLPVQLAAQVGLVARIATMHGHLPTHDYCRELICAAVGGGLLRAGAQQIVKAIPVLGWVVSGVLGGVATWLVGQTALAAFERRISAKRASTLVKCWWRRVLASRSKGDSTRARRPDRSRWQRLRSIPKAGWTYVSQCIGNCARSIRMWCRKHLRRGWRRCQGSERHRGDGLVIVAVPKERN